MSKKRMQLLILALAFCMVLCIFYSMRLQQGDLIEYLSFVDDQHHLSFEPFYDEAEDKYYLFLPSYTSPEDITLSRPFYINTCFGRGGAFSTLPLSEDISVTLSTFSRTEEYVFQIWQCANLPTIYLETQSGSMDYVHEDKNNKEDVSVSIINSDGTIELSGMAELNGRGNTTWDLLNKKSYNLTFSKNITFGPFQEIHKICMLANHNDRSKLRNSLVYYAAQELGIQYASPYMSADLYINGEYVGLYGLVTKNEYLKHINNDQIKAVFEVAHGSHSVDFVTNLGIPIDILWGEPSIIEKTIFNFENALADSDWDLCKQYISFSSFADRYVLEEFFGNSDLTAGSKFFFIDHNNVIHSMLAWDYDWSLGNQGTSYDKFSSYKIFAYTLMPQDTTHDTKVYLILKTFVEVIDGRAQANLCRIEKY